MAEEAGLFSFGDVVGAITAKLIRRHPHVFGPARDLTPAEVKALWDTIKSAEKAERRVPRAKRPACRTQDGASSPALPASLPALIRAQKLTTKAAKVGFRLARHGAGRRQDRGGAARGRGGGRRRRPDRIEDEIGDLLFAVANLARHHGIDPEKALRRTNASSSTASAPSRRA